MRVFQNGDQIGSYELVRRIGEDGIGEVFQARHRHIGRDAAIKILRSELSRDEVVLKRFFTEARATAAIRHAGIVQILDCDLSSEGQAYLVMELLQGENLARRLQRIGRFPPGSPMLTGLLRQIAATLAAAHSLGIVHRDLKPENVFLLNDGGPTPLIKILDFGVAKLLYGDGDAHRETRTGSILGTPAYMAPEQCRSAVSIDHRADIYALGCVSFEMMAGRPPFVRSEAREVLVAHLTEVAPRLSSLVPAIPQGLDDLVANMLAKAPADRPQTMNHVLARLEDLDEGGREVPVGRVATQIMPVEPTTDTPERNGFRPGRVVAGATLILPEPATTMRGDDTSAPETLGSSPRPALKRWGGPAAALVMASLAWVIWARSSGPPASTVVPSAEAIPDFSGHSAASTLPAPKSPAPESVDVTVQIATRPPGAQLWVEAESAPRGLTPLFVRLRRDGPALRAILRENDYVPAPVLLDPHEPRPPVVVMTKKTPSAGPDRQPHRRSHKQGDPDEPFKAIGD